MENTCTVQDPDQQVVSRLRQDLGIHEVTACCLVTRGVSEAHDARAFLEPRLSALRPPDGLAGLSEALPRLILAAQAGETVGVFGDYDVDGVTTAALLAEALESFGMKAVCRVASRHAGYGFGVPDAMALVDAGCSLIIAGDCGTSDLDAIEAATERGVPVIVIDHHTVPSADTTHPALALINPFRPDSSFPFQGMASVGLAFYVMGALRTALRKADHFKGRIREPNVCDWLDLVALGTIADLVPLSEENRIMTTEGLRRLAERKRPGVAALLEMAGVKRADKIDEQTVGWKLGPRLNAPGRLGDAQPSLDVLRAPDQYSAQAAARVIETLNNERRSAQEVVFEEALERLGQDDPGPAIVVAGEGWPHGVVGIIASRLVDRFQRPALVIAINVESGESRGSARSFGGVNLYNALHACKDHLGRYGGHEFAAGFSLPNEGIDAFRTALHGAVAAQEMQSVPLVSCDAEVEVSHISERLVLELGALGPFGKGNAEPVLMSRGVEVTRSSRVGDGSHLKLVLRDAGGRELSAIAFGMGDQDPGVGARIDLAYRPQISSWAGQRRLELSVRKMWLA